MRRYVLVVVALALIACSGDDTGSPATEGSASVTTPSSAEASTSTSTSSSTTSTSSSTTTSTSTAPTTTDTVVPYPDHVSAQYAGTQNWICHPDLPADVCRDLVTTVLAADGTATVEQAAPAVEPSFDCFYAYPTTSTDTGPNSDLVFDQSESDTVLAQVARFSSVCRVFAPVYRSVTLTALGGGAGPEARDLAYGDVVDAWRSYVSDHNDGRGVVLIGHSQGAGHLRRLLDEEIGGTPAASGLIVSAMLLGTSVPVDGVTGIPPCTSADETGCIVSFSSYPAQSPPTAGALFGTMRDTGEPALCTDPAALLGGDGVVDTTIPSVPSLLGGVTGYEGLGTPFVTLSDAVRIACVTSGGYGFLGVELAASPDDVRNLVGLVQQGLGPTWGLHLLDANLAQDALIELAARQAAAHAGRP